MKADVYEGKYVQMYQIGDGKPYTIGGIIFKPTDEQKKILGEKYSYEDLMSYFYNSQKPIPLELMKDGIITLNGEEFPIEKLDYNPLKPIKYKLGTLCAYPEPFPGPFEISIGCENYTRKLRMTRIPHESVNVVAFASLKEEPLYVECRLDDNAEKKFNMTISLNLKYAKSVRDIVEATMIYNAYVDGKGYLCGEVLQEKLMGEKACHYAKESTIFWEKVLRIEEALDVSFVLQHEDIDFDTICLVEQLYQNLINSCPVRDKQIINSIDGSWNITNKRKDIHESVGHPIYFEFEATTRLELFGVTKELPSLMGIFNAVLSDYSVKGEKQTIMLADESPEKKRYTSIMCFRTEKELKEFKKIDHGKLMIMFRDAKSSHEYLQ